MTTLPWLLPCCHRKREPGDSFKWTLHLHKHSLFWHQQRHTPHVYKLPTNYTAVCKGAESSYVYTHRSCSSRDCFIVAKRVVPKRRVIHATLHKTPRKECVSSIYVHTYIHLVYPMILPGLVHWRNVWFYLYARTHTRTHTHCYRTLGWPSGSHNSSFPSSALSSTHLAPPATLRSRTFSSESLEKAMQNPVTVEHRVSPLDSVTSHRTSQRGSSVFDDESESHGTIDVVWKPERVLITLSKAIARKHLPKRFLYLWLTCCPD